MTFRFDDDGTILESFADEMLVECPNCARLCRVVPDPNATASMHLLQSPHKATCANCGFVATSDGKSLSVGTACDWYFGFPLWLQSNCNGEVLWALNERHLDWLKAYVSATYRLQKPNVSRSMASRLPNWIKGKHERRAVLRAINLLYKKLK